MDDQAELFDRSKEYICPFARRHESTKVCALHKNIRHLEEIRRQIDYLRDQVWDLWLRLERYDVSKGTE
jgi:hypothetical protein